MVSHGLDIPDALAEQIRQEAERARVTVPEFLQTLLNYAYFFETYRSGLFSPMLDRPFNEQLQAAFKEHQALIQAVREQAR